MRNHGRNDRNIDDKKMKRWSANIFLPSILPSKCPAQESTTSTRTLIWNCHGPSTAPGRAAVELVLQGDSEKAKPGLKGNLIVEILAKPNPAAAAKKGPMANRRLSLGSLPAVPFEIVER